MKCDRCKGEAKYSATYALATFPNVCKNCLSGLLGQGIEKQDYAPITPTVGKS